MNFAIFDRQELNAMLMKDLIAINEKLDASRKVFSPVVAEPLSTSKQKSKKKRGRRKKATRKVGLKTQVES